MTGSLYPGWLISQWTRRNAVEGWFDHSSSPPPPPPPVMLTQKRCHVTTSQHSIPAIVIVASLGIVGDHRQNENLVSIWSRRSLNSLPAIPAIVNEHQRSHRNQALTSTLQVFRVRSLPQCDTDGAKICTRLFLLILIIFDILILICLAGFWNKTLPRRLTLFGREKWICMVCSLDQDSKSGLLRQV